MMGGVVAVRDILNIELNGKKIFQGAPPDLVACYVYGYCTDEAVLKFPFFKARNDFLRNHFGVPRKSVSPKL
jgi:hypothetical protein